MRAIPVRMIAGPYSHLRSHTQPLQCASLIPLSLCEGQ
jgi:hypothetical protein